MKISVIIPCYNIEEYIERTIYSVLNQSYKNFELILVNDGSKDTTLNILRKIEKKDNRISIIDQKNDGVSSARNSGLKVATGEYIYFLDGDDIIETTLFEEAVNSFEKDKDIDVFSFNFDLIDENLSQIRKFNFNKYNKNIFSNKIFLSLFFKKRIKQHLCSGVIKSEVLVKNKIFFNEGYSYAEDQDFQIRYLLKANKIYFSSDIYFHYLMRKNSAMNSKLNLNWLNSFEVLYSLRNKINDKKLLNDFNLYLQLFYFFMLRRVMKSKSLEGFQFLEKRKQVLKCTSSFNFLNTTLKWNYSFLSKIIKIYLRGQEE